MLIVFHHFDDQSGSVGVDMISTALAFGQVVEVVTYDAEKSLNKLAVSWPLLHELGLEKIIVVVEKYPKKSELCNHTLTVEQILPAEFNKLCMLHDTILSF